MDYLLKPFTLERFLQATEKAKIYYRLHHHADIPKQDFLLLRVDYSLVKVLFANILFIEGLDDYLKIYLKDQRPIVTSMTMKTMTEKLLQTEFIRVHRSYIIPFSKIESVRSKIIYIAGEEIPIGTSYEESFFSRYR